MSDFRPKVALRTNVPKWLPRRVWRTVVQVVLDQITEITAENDDSNVRIIIGRPHPHQPSINGEMR